MATATPKELALQAEVQQLRARIAEIESERRTSQQAEERNCKLLAALQEEKDRLAAVIATISDEVWFADVHKRFTLANPPALREFKLPEGDEIGVENLAASLEVYLPDGSPRPIEDAPPLRALNGELIRDEEEIIRTPGTGELRHRLVSSAPVKDAAGNIVGAVSVVRDVTERKRAEVALRESEERFRAQVTASSDVVYRMNPDWSEMHQLQGRDFIADTEESSGAWLQKYIHPDDQPRVLAAIDEAIRTKSIFELEHRVLRVDGSLGWTFSRAIPMLDANGEIVEWLGAASDITNRKRAGQALRESEEQFRTLANAIPQLCLMANADGWVFWHNKRWYAYTGTTPEQMEGWGWQSVHDPETLPQVLDRWKASIATGEPFDMVFPLRGADGVFRPFLTRVVPVRDRDGNVTRWFGTNTDISEQLKNEEALRASEERLRLAQQAAKAGTWEWDLRTSENRWSDELWQLYGLQPDSCTPSYDAWLATVHPDDREAAARTVQAAAGAGGELSVEWRVQAGNGPARWLLSRGQPQRGAGGRIVRYLGIVLDITAIKTAEEALRESEERLRLAQTRAAAGVWDWDTRTGGLHFTPELEQLYGLAPGSIRTYEDWRRLAHHDDIAKVEAERDRAIANHEPFDLEFRILHASGETRWLSAKGGALYDDAGEAIRVLGVNVDITARKQAEGTLRRSETALRESEARFRLALKNAPVSVAAQDRDLRYIWAYNQRSARQDRIIGYHDHDIFTAGEAAQITAIKRRVLEEGIELRRKMWLERPGGPMYLDVCWEPIRDQAGQIVGVASATMDLTPIKLAEEALAGAMQRLSAHMDNSPLAIVEFDPEFRVTRWSKEAEKLFGWTAEEVLGRAIAELRWVHEDDAEAVSRVSQDMLTGKSPRNAGTNRNYRKDGSTVECEWYNSAIFDAGGKLTSILSQVLDVTGRKRAEEAIRESESRERARAAELEALMEMTPTAIFVSHDPECRHMTGNRRAYELLRWDCGKNISKSAPEGEEPTSFRAMKDGIEIPPADLPLQKAASTGQLVRDYAFDAVFEDGVTLNLLCDAAPLLDESGRPRGGVGVLSDVTEIRRAEQRLRQAQKLESIGLLAGGVAHDFNNLLVGVVGNASLAQDMLPPDHPVADLLAGVLKSGEQAAHLTRQMLAYSGKGKFVVEPLDLSALVPEMSDLVRPSIPKKIALRFDLENELPAVEADRGQIQQVFMNLTLNAADAIGSQEGLITVRTGVRDVDESYMKLHPDLAALAPGKYVYLEVRDTGCGMDEATKARIFDPFFTTKFIGRGLGLAAVSGILRGHGSGITVSSTPGKGSCFTVFFPATTSTARKGTVEARDTSLQGAGTVLVVDDERVVLEMAKRALERHGYEVLTADSGLAAIDVFRRRPGEIALVILDLSMPHMSGQEALPELREIRPDVEVVVSSGYSESEAMALFGGQRVSGFVQKPYTAKGIAEKVKECLAKFGRPPQ